ncbi:MAG: hypothetical protein DWQ47_01445 [Acidobacteria bacterium]|nr:MAG: hypothetical protein DWQ32_11905 [Acidobacteriota bacterium]REK04161.1 MAG: hypothetical protein DWQ38_01430 [Acidobacteriota bacterium]REK15323.1 MAG: hypothetical protein DWQ43_17595 [Acidobacteriota bacterium]REK46413.1 MAG: hypothetical protein DWQ47_01445 [Acidobacteriota bacterium]
MKRITLLFSLLFLPVTIGAQPEVNTGEYLIAYNVLVDNEKDDYDVWVMNIDGSGKKNITNHPDVAWTYFAHDDELFFISDRGKPKRNYYLFKTDATGNSPIQVSEQRLEDSWMSARNGASEMVVAGRIGDEVRMQLFLIDLETGKSRQLTNEKGALHRDPLFSPDGKQIVYAYKPDRMNREVYEDLWIMDADGTNRRRLTTYPMDDKTSQWHSYHAGAPRWAPGRNFITYQSFQKGKSSLFAVTPDGKKQWKLTENELNEGWHAWSPDGKWLAIEMYDDENTEFGIYLMNFDTKEVKKLTDPKDFRFQQAPVFVKRAR